MRSITGVLLAAAMLTAGFAAAASAQEIGGKYNVKGTNFDGSPYGGTATIATGKSTCRIHWQTGSTSDGFCMVADKSVAAAYKMGDDVVGLVLYQLQPDGSLKGVWTIADKPGSGTEILTPFK